MTWMQTVSGMSVDLLNPRPEQILLGDIAHALARIPRFCGHTIGERTWTVAQHSLLVESLMPESSDASDRLVALLHDAHEAYVGDLITPVKQAMDACYTGHQEQAPASVFRRITASLDRVIWQAFGLYPIKVDALGHVRQVDMLALRVEKDLLMSPARREWDRLPDPPDPMPDLSRWKCESATEAEIMFRRRFNALHCERHGLARLAAG